MDLRDKLEDLLNHLSSNEDAITINHYFAFNFWDDYPDEDEDVLDFLSETFIDVDMMCIDGMEIEKPVKKALTGALQMIEKKSKGTPLVSLKMNLDDYEKVEKLLPDLRPDVSFSLKEADHNLVRLGVCRSAPCIATFILDSDEFENMLLDLMDIETDAFKTGNGLPPKEATPAYQKYLKYGCLYDILSNAEKIPSQG